MARTWRQRWHGQAAGGPRVVVVVAAAFYNFNPALVARCIPRAWQLASPAAVIASADMAALAGLVRDAASACGAEGRPLYAGHADLDWPEAPHLVMWHGLTLLREHRGDGHVAALLASGLSGIEALVTHTATGKGFLPGFARASRGWSQEQWDAVTDDLVARGLLEADGGLTSAGQALRAQAEAETDKMAASPWQHLGEERTEELAAIGLADRRAGGHRGPGGHPAAVQPGQPRGRRGSADAAGRRQARHRHRGLLHTRRRHPDRQVRPGSRGGTRRRNAPGPAFRPRGGGRARARRPRPRDRPGSGAPGDGIRLAQPVGHGGAVRGDATRAGRREHGRARGRRRADTGRARPPAGHRARRAVAISGPAA